MMRKKRAIRGGTEFLKRKKTERKPSLLISLRNLILSNYVCVFSKDYSRKLF